MNWQFSKLQIFTGWCQIYIQIYTDIQDDASHFMAHTCNLLDPDHIRKKPKVYNNFNLTKWSLLSSSYWKSIFFQRLILKWFFVYFLSTEYLCKFLFRKSDPNCCLHDFSPVPRLDCIMFFLPHRHVYKKSKQVQKELYNIFCIFGDYN